jgi:hypothetical protein
MKVQEAGQEEEEYESEAEIKACPSTRGQDGAMGMEGRLDKGMMHTGNIGCAGNGARTRRGA